MKAGDLVEFKAGLFGFEAPKNLGIYLERVKRKGSFYVVLHTLRGKQEIRPDNLTARKLSARVDVESMTENELTERLKVLVNEVAKGALDERPQVKPGEINDRVLWNKVWDAGEQNPEQMATRYFKTPTPKKSEIEAVRNVLATCARPGVGYFERLPGRGENWRPLTLDQYKAIARDVEGINKLRNKLIHVEELPPEDEWTPPKTVFKGIPIEEAPLDADDRRRLQLLQTYMAEFVLKDKDEGTIGLAQTGVHTIDGFNLFNFTKWFATDWVGTQTRTSLSSTLVEFLLRSGHWNVQDAIVTIAKRKVSANGSFEWDEDKLAAQAAQRFTRDFPAQGRVDLRHLPCWTIDPHDAKDHDDAVGVEFHDDGTTTLWVHIADVSHYVEKDGTLDRHARKRATSVYLPTGVLPMLPPHLSNDLCSLNEGEDRFAMTAKITYSPEGDVLNESFHESLVRVTGNVSYEEVLAQIEAADPANTFVKIEAFARKLDARRRGLPIETGELRVRVTAEGVTHAIKQGNRATKMIEVFMVAANEAVARFLTRKGAACMYRCHPLPDRVSVDKFNAQAKTMELPIEIKLPARAPDRPAGASEDAPEDADAPSGGGSSILDQLKSGGKLQLFSGGFVNAEDEADRERAAGSTPHPEDPTPSAPAPVILKGLAQLSPEEQEAWLAPFRSALAQVEAIPDARLREVVYVKSLSCMGRAIYTPQNLGHFGLGSTCYCHFTSPIRRYADLVVHRQLRWLLRGRQGEPPHDVAGLVDLSQHCSDQSVAADQLERDVVGASMVFASRDGGWDGAQDAVVNGITKGGVFCALPHGLEARVATADIPGGPWDVDDAESMLLKGSATRAEMQEEVTAKNWRELVDAESGEVRKVRVRLGDALTVSIVGRDYVDGKVSARLAMEGAPDETP